MTYPDNRIGDELDRLRALLRRAQAYADCLTDNDIRFVDSMVSRTDQFGPTTFVSAKQRKWLEAIERRLDQAEAPKDPDDPDPVARPVDEVMR